MSFSLVDQGATMAADRRQFKGTVWSLARLARTIPMSCRLGVDVRYLGTINQNERNTIMTHDKPKLTQHDLRQFTGDLERYRHPLNRTVTYTPGVQYVAEVGQAYWLLDAIASWIGTTEFNEAASRDDRISEMHFWTLAVDPNKSAKLCAKADSPDESFIEQVIAWTDFPLDKIDIWAAFDGEHWTLYLPSEH